MPLFLRLNDVVLPAPAAALVCVLLLAGMVTAATSIGRLFGVRERGALGLAVGFVMVVSLLAAGIHGMALAHISSVGSLRVVGGLIVVAGIGGLSAVLSRALCGGAMARPRAAARCRGPGQRLVSRGASTPTRWSLKAPLRHSSVSACDAAQKWGPGRRSPMPPAIRSTRGNIASGSLH